MNNKYSRSSQSDFAGNRTELNANAYSFVPSSTKQKSTTYNLHQNHNQLINNQRKEQERKKKELQEKILAMEKQKEELQQKVEDAARAAKMKEELEEQRATQRFREEQEMKKEKAKRAGNLLSGFKDSLKNKASSINANTLEDKNDSTMNEMEKKKSNAENETKKQIERVLQAGTDWAVLNLPRGSKKKWLTQSYRELAKSLHPDKCALPRAKQAFQRVKEAYENLSKDAEEEEK